MQHTSPPAPMIHNRKARHRFEIIERVQCGLALRGTEVKSLRAAQASLDEAFARIENGEAWLLGCHIAPYSHGRGANHDPTRRRKLLLRRAEIRKLQARVTQKGLTLVPLNVFFNERGLAKLTLALARGKSHVDKRESLKKHQHQRDIDRAMGRRR